MDKGMELGTFFAVVWRNAWIVALAAAVGLGLAFGMMTLQGPTWQAETSVVVSPRAAQPSGSLYGVEVLDLNIVGTYVQLLRSRHVLEGAADALESRYGVAKLARAEIDVRPVENSSVVVVAVRSEDRGLATELADTIVALAIDSNPVPVLEEAYPMVVLDPAATGERPAAPNARLGLLLGVLAGALLGVGGALLLDRGPAPRPVRRRARTAA